MVKWYGNWTKFGTTGFQPTFTFHESFNSKIKKKDQKILQDVCTYLHMCKYITTGDTKQNMAEIGHILINISILI